MAMAGCALLFLIIWVHLMRSLDNAAASFSANKPYIGKFYDCVNNTCILSKFPVSEMYNNQASGSIDVCRLTCGLYGALWPRPTIKTEIKQSIIQFGYENIKLNLSSVEDELGKQYINEAYQVFLDSLGNLCKPRCNPYANSVTIFVSNTSSFEYLKWTTNEKYDLSIVTEGDQINVKITAQTVYGVRHGMETLRQLITSYGSKELGYNLVIATEVNISDRPVYSHRGFMLDTSRHFFSMSKIKKTIDAMGHSKLNVFHWHVTDSHSFPLDLPSVPLMFKYGSYSPEQKYSYDEIKDLMRYALVRGVRIIIEIDSPAHAGNGWQWGKSEGFGDLAVCVDKNPWRKYCVQPPCGQLNPINNNTYFWLGNLYKDIISLLPQGEAFHMGGDEVAINCWNTTDQIVNWMKSKNKDLSENSFYELWSDFHIQALKAFDKKAGDSNSNIIVWSSGLTEPSIIQKHLDNNRFIIEEWESSTAAAQLTELGYKVIVATKEFYYLDHGFWPPTNYHSWKLIYETKLPIVNNTHLILGAETCMWSEYVDENSVDFKIWPRTAALAERLWSNPKTRAQTAEYRLLQHNERLLKLGIKPDAIMPEWCYDREGECKLET
ncbi:chitooligosaccharidolytic beta-N-acetylglucosaminidase-like isoform X2 [Daktulosphaira vitifoliae]|nr:chitooligosaccharidolytic beta-N-acetylglucosaminidase-like isoform X2 [Daktulosphaira vitifoliae]XP_050546977.1 chitooligosaccharidolytic beta-N-acetylglucosaminidase-like isoform X2 [Daktulosphaira vitifoliae]XP_050546978.1 chitooligosaccharidolytic beta-N-acetylglucosaminidase-like isoform X2 [Daktulosphaira vitifoliae]XP_050546979.1 chitooligosaccharidolytic beta-N-acetylglucosaminidase-like isoform X2 [Daktulosphaira vitifoliae]XP_050546980.1 chitooligosaccharidolytic beta-N-acetylgluco